MAVYRQQRRINRRIVIIAVAVIAVIVVFLAIFFNSRKALAPANPADAARAKAVEAAQGLDILAVEYPKVLKGEPSGAIGSFNRAKSTFDSAKNDLAQLNATATDQIAADFATLQQKIDLKAAADEVIALADKVKAALLKL